MNDREFALFNTFLAHVIVSPDYMKYTFQQKLTQARDLVKATTGHVGIDILMPFKPMGPAIGSGEERQFVIPESQLNEAEDRIASLQSQVTVLNKHISILERDYGAALEENRVQKKMAYDSHTNALKIQESLESKIGQKEEIIRGIWGIVGPHRNGNLVEAVEELEKEVISLNESIRVKDASMNHYKRDCVDAEEKLKEMNLTIGKIWEAVGNPTYGSLGGKAIWEVVADLKHKCDIADATGGKYS